MSGIAIVSAPPVGAGDTVIWKVGVAAPAPLAPLAYREMPAYVPAVVGIPPTAPVAAARSRPGGSVPEATLQVTGAVRPEDADAPA